MSVLVACSGEDRARRAQEAYALASQIPTPAMTLSGNYLAGRFAQRAQDWDAAQSYMTSVAEIDHSNLPMLQRAFLLSLGSGQYSKARAQAMALMSDQYRSVAETDLAIVFLACDHLSRNEFSQARDMVQMLSDDGFGDYTKPLLSAWTLAGEGKPAEALNLLKQNAGGNDATYSLHAGMIEALAGNKDAAIGHYKVVMENGLTLQSAVIIGRFFERHGMQDVSREIFDKLGRLYPFNPFEAQAGTVVAGDGEISRAADGASVALFDIATLLYERRSYDSAQIYGSLAALLSPQSPFIHLMMGDIAALNQQPEKALASYDMIREGSSLYWLSRMRVAEVYEINGNLDAATEQLTKLAQNPQTRVEALVTLGDIHRRNENFAEAVKAYDGALEGIETITEDHWAVIYARGMALERLDRWAQAEKDLLTALDLQPDNPMILNFIGYSWADKGVNLDRAVDYIRRAVELRPGDGAILDSLGWALYKQGNYADAADWIEKAAAMLPDDPTILDHLGDAYWQTGRTQEARFQWQRARGLSKDAVFRQGLEVKIKSSPATMPPAALPQREAKL